MQYIRIFHIYVSLCLKIAGKCWQRSVIAKFSEILINALQPLFDAPDLVADRLKQRLRDKLRPDKRVKKGVAVNGNGKKDRRVGRKESALLVRDNDDLLSGVVGHLRSDLIHRRIAGKAEDDQAVFSGDVAHMVDGA